MTRMVNKKLKWTRIRRRWGQEVDEEDKENKIEDKESRDKDEKDKNRQQEDEEERMDKKWIDYDIEDKDS